MKTKLLREFKKNLIEIITYKDEISGEITSNCIKEGDKYYTVSYGIKHLNYKGEFHTVFSTIYSDCVLKALKSIIGERRYKSLLENHEKTVANRNRSKVKEGYKVRVIYTNY